MGVKVWLLAADMERLQERTNVYLEPYADFKERDSIMSGVIERDGIFSQLRNHFVLGKVKYWEREGSAHRTPFLRIDNHPGYPDGLVLTPNSEIDIKYNRHHKTIDQTTSLHRVELLAAPDNDFIQRIFTTYEVDCLVAKTKTFTRNLLVYCDERHLSNGRVSFNGSP